MNDEPRATIEPMSASEREELRVVAERRLTPEEFDAYVNAPMSESEREEILALRAWFMRRYPTAGDRFAWCRRAFRRWQRKQRAPDAPPSHLVSDRSLKP